MIITALTYFSLMVAAFAADQERRQDQDVDAAQFSNLVRTMLSDVHDITLVFEGGITDHNATGKGEGESFFQGLYSFRSDGATLLDVFFRSPSLDKPGSRTINAVLGQRLSTVSQIPDLGISRPSQTGAAPGVLNRPNSPERILYLWYLQTLNDPAGFGYEFQGWEAIGEHRCMRVQLSQLPIVRLSALKGDPPRIRLWIDMMRGFNPLKAEFLYGEKLFMRTDKIELRKIEGNGNNPIWLPIRGETNTFHGVSGNGRASYGTTPVFTETYSVVDGSVRINQNLKDTYFTVNRKDSMPEVAGLRRMQRELNSIIPKYRTDPIGVQERLDRQLAEADRQAKQLEASALSRVSFSWYALLPYSFAIVGVGFIGGALVLKRRFT